ncbi:universal stress protein [Radiobacillus kanasensis]|uniref:universal stress protein n=1 Tax=Radiobacillus kanasensis TaxID=2844358 RepID=UPI001E53E43C|nr:universal stress protein [Radiobacillus kanasensis]UFT98030.1 universal stress protein [Radiobacillus kanasensis]
MKFEYNRILVAVDGSKASEHAFHKAVEICKRNHARMILAHIVDTRTFTTLEAYDHSLADRAEEYGTTLLQDYESKATEAGVGYVDTLMDYGSPKVKIPKEMAVKSNADLIICGATGLNAVERFLIGSVSESITRYAKCDVLVVRG